MDIKEFKIEIPEGYEIDEENSTFEKIVFKKKDNKSKSWKEYCSKEKIGGKCFINQNSYIIEYNKHSGNNLLHSEIDRNLITSKEEAEAFLALMQLRQLRKAWVEEWEPDWNNFEEVKYGIRVCKNEINVSLYKIVSNILSFPTKEMAEEFIECFKDLLEIAKILL